MIIKTEEKGGIKIYTVDKEYDDAKMAAKMNTFIKAGDIKKIIDHNADVFTTDGRLLLRFRKNVLDRNHADAFYENVKDFAKNVSSNRGGASGNRKKKDLGTNPKVMSNIFGYFDKWTASQKAIFKKHGRTPKVSVRECRFNLDYPEQYKETIPLIKDIDRQYEKLVPDNFKLQSKKAKQTHFKIADTSFTTVTTNINYQTSIHTDKGDDPEGFGNLAVIEKGGEYTGGETCLPQYGIGVDVRTGDILFMDVHEPHANLPIHKKSKDAIRLSIVCYLRIRVWQNTANKTRKFYESHNKTVKKLRKSPT